MVWQKQANLLDTTDPSFMFSVTLWTQEFNSIFSFIYNVINHIILRAWSFSIIWPVVWKCWSWRSPGIFCSSRLLNSWSLQHRRLPGCWWAHLAQYSLDIISLFRSQTNIRPRWNLRSNIQVSPESSLILFVKNTIVPEYLQTIILGR